MKRSELKQLIREVIEELKSNDFYEADSEFETTVDIQTPSGNEVKDVPVHVYAYLLPTRQEISVITKIDIKDGNEVVFPKGEDVFDYVTQRTYDRVYRAIS